MTEVVVPRFAEGGTKIRLVSWFKKEGDTVTAGESMAEASTSKVSVFIEAPVGGRVARILCHQGSEVSVGQALALIE
ncbi:MAG: biotin/lipoyl-binding protein [Firmicutes bacterium]|nr:biotin/lipoyl-binding protein [Bacillota bacterium]